MRFLQNLQISTWIFPHVQTHQVIVHSRKVFTNMRWRVAIILVSTLILFQINQTLNAPMAHAAPLYTCGLWNQTGGHCYGQWDWRGHVEGSQTQIGVVGLVCNGGCVNDGFITNEMWLTQSGNSACTSNNCWVEGGYLNTGLANDYFWADNRPNYGYAIHYPEGIASGDIGHPVFIEIDHSGTNQFTVSKRILGCSSNCSGDFSYNSTSNTMYATDIQIGQELTGNTGGASAPSAHFQFNYWSNGNQWNPQTGLGNPGSRLRSDDPPYAYWKTQPGPSTTGDLVTFCC